MKLWKLLLGILGLLGGLFAANSSRKKEIKELEGVIKENKKEEKKVVISKENLPTVKRKHRKCKRLMTITILNLLLIF